MKLIRLYADAAGESHFGDCEVPLSLRQFAPPAAPFQISDPQAATQLFMLELPRGWLGEMHVSPKRQLMFCLSGCLKVTSSTGDVRFLNSGEGLLMEDTTGKGHVSEAVSDTPVVEIIVQLE
jgi:hypothetical protein